MKITKIWKISKNQKLTKKGKIGENKFFFRNFNNVYERNIKKKNSFNNERCPKNKWKLKGYKMNKYLQCEEISWSYKLFKNKNVRKWKKYQKRKNLCEWIIKKKLTKNVYKDNLFTNWDKPFKNENRPKISDLEGLAVEELGSKNSNHYEINLSQK